MSFSLPSRAYPVTGALGKLLRPILDETLIRRQMLNDCLQVVQFKPAAEAAVAKRHRAEVEHIDGGATFADWTHRKDLLQSARRCV